MSEVAPVFVRTASPRDLDALCALLREIWHDTYDALHGVERVNEISTALHSRGALSARFDMPNTEFLVADDGSEIAGLAFAESADDGKTVMLRELCVKPGRQGQGIGGLLLDEIEGCFPDAQTVRIELEEENARAVRFHLAQGFSQCGSAPIRQGAGMGVTAVIYERPILWAD